MDVAGAGTWLVQDAKAKASMARISHSCAGIKRQGVQYPNLRGIKRIVAKTFPLSVISVFIRVHHYPDPRSPVGEVGVDQVPQVGGGVLCQQGEENVAGSLAVGELTQVVVEEIKEGLVAHQLAQFSQEQRPAQVDGVAIGIEVIRNVCVDRAVHPAFWLVEINAVLPPPV